MLNEMTPQIRVNQAINIFLAKKKMQLEIFRTVFFLYFDFHFRQTRLIRVVKSEGIDKRLFREKLTGIRRQWHVLKQTD